MLEFGVITQSYGHNGYYLEEKYMFTLDNLDLVLDKYRDYRVKGDRNEAYDFLTNPKRRKEPSLWLGYTEAYPFGDDEEYFLVRGD